MSRQRFIALLIAALAVISGALYLSAQRNVVREVLGLPLLPSLSAELSTVTSLSVLKGGATPSVTVHKQGEQWTVAERANYPADVPKLRKLLLALSDAKIREEKTADPANYSIIGVEDPTKPGATGAQIELLAKSGKRDLIVGKPVEQGSFVRRVGEKSSYIVEPGISIEAEPRYWIDTRLLDIPAEKVQSIQFKPQAGPGYALRRVSEPAGKFVLEGVPSGRQAADSNALSASSAAFSNLTDDDVAPGGDIDFSKPTTVTLTLSDGSVLTFTGAAAGEKRWVQVSAPKDASITAKAGGRAFEIAAYRYDQIFRPLEQLLAPKPAPAAKSTPSAKPAPPGAKKPAAADRP